MPPQNPITRIEQVARDLGELAEELDAFVGPDAKRALLHWRSELLQASDEIQRTGTEPPSRPRPADTAIPPGPRL